MKNQKGQTLIEVIIAVFIMIVGVVSLVSVAITYNVMSRQSSHEIIAMNLAREAAEVFRNQRDTNYLAIETGALSANQLFNVNYFYGLDGGSILDFTSSISLNTTTGQWTLNYAADGLARVYLNSGYYSQTSSSGATVTPYYRLIYTYPICADNSTRIERINSSTTSTTLCNATETQVGVDVRIRIYWLENTAAKNYYLQEKLYDWKY